MTRRSVGGNVGGRRAAGGGDVTQGSMWKEPNWGEPGDLTAVGARTVPFWIWVRGTGERKTVLMEQMLATKEPVKGQQQDEWLSRGGGAIEQDEIKSRFGAG